MSRISKNQFHIFNTIVVKNNHPFTVHWTPSIFMTFTKINERWRNTVHDRQRQSRPRRPKSKRKNLAAPETTNSLTDFFLEIAFLMCRFWAIRRKMPAIWICYSSNLRLLASFTVKPQISKNWNKHFLDNRWISNPSSCFFSNFPPPSYSFNSEALNFGCGQGFPWGYNLCFGRPTIHAIQIPYA